MTVSKEADRIRKLLAHAESCTNEKEAAAFFAQAQKIQMEYAISQEEIMAAQAAAENRTLSDEPIISRVIWTYEKNGELPIWIHVLATSICKANNGTCLGTSQYRRGPKSYIKAWGRASDLEVSEEMVRVIVAQVRRLCGAYAKKKGIRDNDVLRDYRMGCTNTITELLNQQKALVTQEIQRKAIAGQCTALMRLTDIATRARDQQSHDCPGARSRKANYSDHSAAYRQGRLDGHTVHHGGHKAIGG